MCSVKSRRGVTTGRNLLGPTMMAILSVAWAFCGPVVVAAEIYTHHSFGRLGVLDTATGVFTDVGPYELPESTGLTATAFGPDGTLYGMVQGFVTRGGMSRLVVLDQQTGKATPIGYANPINTVALDIAPNGTAYVAGFEEPALAMKGDPNLYTIDTDTGQLTSIGSTGIDRIMDFAFDSTGTMWATTGNELYVIDRGTAISEHVASITGVDVATNDPNAEIMGIMFDEYDVLYATAFIEGSPLFTIDTTTGQATVAAEPGLSFPHGGDIYILPRPVASAVYTSYNMGQSLCVLDVATGEFRDAGSYQLPESTGMTATAFDPDGTLYGMLQGFGTRGGMSQLMVIDPRTGKANPVGFANPINTVGLDFGPDGTAYVAGFEQPLFAMEGDTNLYAIDAATGQLTLIGDTGIDRIMDFAFDSAGTMWATTGNELYTIDTSNGASQHVVSISGVDTATGDPAAEIMGIMFDENDVLYATAFIEGSPLFTIDPVTGQATAVSQPGLSFPHGGDIPGPAPTVVGTFK